MSEGEETDTIRGSGCFGITRVKEKTIFIGRKSEDKNEQTSKKQ